MLLPSRFTQGLNVHYTCQTGDDFKTKGMKKNGCFPHADFTASPMKCWNVENVADRRSREQF